MSTAAASAAEKAKVVAVEEVKRIEKLTNEAARSGAYLYPLRVCSLLSRTYEGLGCRAEAARWICYRKDCADLGIMELDVGGILFCHASGFMVSSLSSDLHLGEAQEKRVCPAVPMLIPCHS